MKVAILAGGTGTRLWPWSRQHNPKQLQSIIGQETLLRQTFLHVRRVVPARDILIVGNVRYGARMKKQLPEIPKENFLLEPVKRESANAIGLAAYYVHARNPQEVLITVAADHWIGDATHYATILKQAGRMAQKNSAYSILMGIRPTYPETGYGYIESSTKFVRDKKFPVYHVKQFVEKPTLAKARGLIRKKNMYWNPGWFVWQVDHLVSLFETYLPENHVCLSEIASARGKGFQKKLASIFPTLKPIAIEYGILEKTPARLVMPVTIQWSDVGHWRSVRDMSHKDADGNVVVGESLLIGAKNNYLSTHSKKLIAAIGIDNIIMIETKDAILITTVERAHETKELVSLLAQDKKFQSYI